MRIVFLAFGIRQLVVRIPEGQHQLLKEEEGAGARQRDELPWAQIDVGAKPVEGGEHERGDSRIDSEGFQRVSGCHGVCGAAGRRRRGACCQQRAPLDTML